MPEIVEACLVELRTLEKRCERALPEIVTG
jgi:hypothetical protein